MQLRLAALACVALALAGCGGTKTITETVPGPTTTLTTRLTATVTDTATATTTVEVTVTQRPSPNPPPSPPAEEGFDEEWARDIATDIVVDLRTVDQRLNDGIGVSSALYLLSDSYARMIDAGIPPGADPATYLARLETLSNFAEQAADVYISDPIEGSATYSVVRRNTGVLFTVLNNAMGTSYALP